MWEEFYFSIFFTMVADNDDDDGDFALSWHLENAGRTKNILRLNNNELYV